MSKTVYDLFRRQHEGGLHGQRRRTRRSKESAAPFYRFRPGRRARGSGGSTTQDYGGMAQDVKNVDTEGAAGVGADPPGGLPIDFGGDTSDDQHDITSAS